MLSPITQSFFLSDLSVLISVIGFFWYITLQNTRPSDHRHKDHKILISKDNLISPKGIYSTGKIKKSFRTSKPQVISPNRPWCYNWSIALYTFVKSHSQTTSRLPQLPPLCRTPLKENDVSKLWINWEIPLGCTPGPQRPSKPLSQ